MKETVINDLVYYKKMKIVQNKDYFKFSLDSILLPNFVKINPKTKLILDLCTGNAPVPLVLSTKTKAKIYGIEIQKEVFELANKTIKMNKLDNQIELIEDDINNITNRFETDTFDLITCNPPYFKISENSYKNINNIKSIARHEIMMELKDIFKVAKKLLKNNGSLCIIHKTDRLIEILNLMQEYNIEPKRIRFVYPKKNKESNLVLIDGRKNGNKGLKLEQPLIIHEEDNKYTTEVLNMFGE